MLNRRAFVQGATVIPVGFALPTLSSAQPDNAKPDFTIAGTAQTDPTGYEIAWSNIWSQLDIEGYNFQSVPGQTGFVVLDSENRIINNISQKQRIVIETNAVAGPVDPEELLNSFEDLHPATHMGYAPGTVIESRHVTEQGCWFSFGPGPQGGGIEGVIGLSLYYTPAVAGTPLLNVVFNLAHGSFRTEEFLEEMDSTISINGNWLMGMDDLGNFWEAIQNSYGWDD